jgi:DNA polymerase-1
MLNLHRLLKSRNLRTRLLLQIHDELVFEVPPEELDVVAPLIRGEMVGALGERLEVPLGVNIEVGDNWLETEAMA